jgi:WD40 repeat protein
MSNRAAQVRAIVISFLHLDVANLVVHYAVGFQGLVICDTLNDVHVNGVAAVGENVAFCLRNNNWSFWDRQTDVESTNGFHITALTSIADDIVVLGGRCFLNFVHAPTNKLLARRTGTFGVVTCLAPAGDKEVVLGSGLGRLEKWSCEQEDALWWHACYASIEAVAVNGTTVLHSSQTCVYARSTQGLCVADFNGHTMQVTSLVFLNGEQFASGALDNTVRIWDLASRTTLATLTGHRSWVTCLALLPHGFLVSGSCDSTVKVWDPQTGSVLTLKPDSKKQVRAVAITPNGELIVCTNDTTTIWE